MAAATSGGTISDVARWLDEQEVDEVSDALEAAGAPEALQAARASWTRDERQRSSVYTTAETVVEAFADPAVAASARRTEIDPGRLLDGTNTLYVCAPVHDQRRLRPLFATLVASVIEEAYERAEGRGSGLDPPLLVVLDEAANVAPLAELDVLASTAAGHGVQLVTVWQDLGQLSSRYGPRAHSVINNHRAKVFLSGIADPQTLEHASQLIGDAERAMVSRTFDSRNASSTTESHAPRRLLPADALRRVAPGKAVLVSGHLPPVFLTLRSWRDDPVLQLRATGRWPGFQGSG
jgi:type IV secretion system protein VirD4